MAARKIFTIGCRVAVAHPSIAAGDALAGTQHLLNEAGRTVLASAYSEATSSGVDAVATGLNTGVAFLENAGFYSDMTRPNDLTHYKTGHGNVPVQVQGRGTLAIPRSGVSCGEKVKFSGTLSKLAVATAKRASGDAMVGASVTYVADGKTFAPATADILFAGDSGNVGDQMVAAAESSPDFFVVHGCSSLSDVQSLADTLETNSPKKVENIITDTKGFETTDGEVVAGFDIPVLLVSSSMESFKEILEAASKVPQIACISSPEPLGESDRAELVAKLASSECSLAEPTSTAGELAIVS